MEKEKKQNTRREPRAHIPEEQMRTHGGARPGSGRPRTGSKAIQFKAPKEMAAFIEQQPNRSAFIKECVERVMKERNPERVTECGYGIMPPLQGLTGAIPFVDVAVAAGSPIGTDAAEYGELTNLLSFFPDAKVALKVEGRSMVDADIHSGDLLLIDNEVNVVEEHHIALCELNGAYTVKHVRRESDGTFVLLPRNEAYQPIVVTPADRFFVRGRVVGVMKHL